MYEQFYGFSERPFQLTPDPAYFFESVTHKKALSYLGYGLAQGEGFIVITGEIGSGKSTIAKAVLRLLPRDSGRAEGRVLLDGDDVLHRKADRRRIAMVFQEPMTSLNSLLKSVSIPTSFRYSARAGVNSVVCPSASITGWSMRSRICSGVSFSLIQ